MKKAFKVLIGCLLSASFFVACNQEAEKKETKPTVKKKVVKKVWKQEEMESSELAVLMRDMWDSTMVRKKQIITRKNDITFLINQLEKIESKNILYKTLIEDVKLNYDQIVDFNLQNLLDINQKVRYYMITDFWKDTGTPEDIIQANKTFQIPSNKKTDTL